MYKQSVERIGLIGDFDNTFVNTKEFVPNHLIATCKDLGIAPPTKINILRVLKTNPRFDNIFTTFFGKRGEGVLARYRETAMDVPYRPIAGGLEAVKKLKASDVLIVIVSNRTNKLSERLAQAKYNPEDFAIMAAIPPKPSQEAYDEALKYLAEKDVKRDHVFITGDSLDDYLACPADLAEHFYAVTTGLNSREEFIRIGLRPENVLNSINDLPSIILKNG